MNESERLSWKDVRNRIRGRILNGTYGPGDRLPRDEDFADEFGCARSTVQRAMRELAQTGVVERRRKGGTHVLTHPVTRATFDIPVTRSEIEATGRTYGYQLVSREVATAPRSVIAAFGLSGPVEMLRIEALHLADQRPYLFEDRWVCTATVPEILEVDLHLHSANEWLVQNRPYSRCDLRFYAANAGEHFSRMMGTQPSDALLIIERTTWIGNAPITSVKSVTAPGYQLLTRV